MRAPYRDGDESMTSLEKMKEEAIQRMQILKLHPMAIKDFKEYGEVGHSFRTSGFCCLSEQKKNQVRQFEKEYGYLVYYLIDSYTLIGRMLSYLYVSSNEEEWEQDRQDLKDGCPIVYVENVDDKFIFSEFGSIGIELRNGGVIRTA